MKEEYEEMVEALFKDVYELYKIMHAEKAAHNDEIEELKERIFQLEKKK